MKARKAFPEGFYDAQTARIVAFSAAKAGGGDLSASSGSKEIQAEVDGWPRLTGCWNEAGGLRLSGQSELR